MDVTAMRDYAYYWQCQCGHRNVQGEIIAGKSNRCHACGELVRVVRIVYENGATLELTREAADSARAAELFRCDVCGEQCESVAALVVHVKKFHRADSA